VFTQIFSYFCQTNGLINDNFFLIDTPKIALQLYENNSENSTCNLAPIKEEVSQKMQKDLRAYIQTFFHILNKGISNEYTTDN